MRPGRPPPCASLGMYDLPEVAAANDTLWSAIADRLRTAGPTAVPDRLDRSRPLAEIWRDPGLVLAQTCGFPLTHGFADRLTLIGTPVYAAPGCSGPAYRSALVARADDPRASVAAFAGASLAVNGFDSQSGWNALAHAVMTGTPRPDRAIGRIVITGGHRASLHAVGVDRADWAAIDAVTWDLLRRHSPDAVSGLHRFGWSAPAPGLPFVTAAHRPGADVERIRAAVAAALADPATARARSTLGLAGLIRLPPAAYDRIRAMARATLMLRCTAEEMTNINEVGDGTTIAIGPV